MNTTVQIRICPKCKKEYPISIEYFLSDKSKKNGLTSYCRICHREQSRKWNKEHPKYYSEYMKNYKKNNEEQLKKYLKEYRKENKEKILKRRKKWRERNKKKLRKQYKEWSNKNKDKIKEYNKNQIERRKIEPQLRLQHSFSALVYYSLKTHGSSKNGYSWEIIVNYTIQDLMKHLEQQFIEGMTWDNYGKWHVDHIIPQSVFNFTSYEDNEFQECWALTNLQPLWSQDNLIKSNKIIKN